MATFGDVVKLFFETLGKGAQHQNSMQLRGPNYMREDEAAGNASRRAAITDATAFESLQRGRTETDVRGRAAAAAGYKGSPQEAVVLQQLAREDKARLLGEEETRSQIDLRGAQGESARATAAFREMPKPVNLSRDDLGDRVDYTDPATGKVIRSVPKGAAPKAGGGVKDVMKLRKEFNMQIKPYAAQRDNFQRLMAAGTDTSGANDVAIIFNYMKMLDPASVVREGEFATAESAGRSIPTGIVQLYNRSLKGERLTDGQRAQFLKSGQQQYESAAKPAIDQLLRFYGEQAVAGGASAQDVVGGFYTPEVSDLPGGGWDQGHADAAPSGAPGAPRKRLRFNPATGELE